MYEPMEDDVKELVLIVGWIMGIILAKGFWSALFAVIIPFWAWYLLIEKIMISFGWIA